MREIILKIAAVDHQTQLDELRDSRRQLISSNSVMWLVSGILTGHVYTLADLKMNISVDARLLTSPIKGIGRYTYALPKAFFNHLELQSSLYMPGPSSYQIKKSRLISVTQLNAIQSNYMFCRPALKSSQGQFNWGDA
jgi:hypothetical protein